MTRVKGMSVTRRAFAALVTLLAPSGAGAPATHPEEFVHIVAADIARRTAVARAGNIGIEQ